MSTGNCIATVVTAAWEGGLDHATAMQASSSLTKEGFTLSAKLGRAQFTSPMGNSLQIVGRRKSLHVCNAPKATAGQKRQQRPCVGAQSILALAATARL
jgi:hypothetical protein